MQRIDPSNEEQVKLSFVITKALETQLNELVDRERKRTAEPVTRSMVLRRALAIGIREMKRSR